MTPDENERMGGESDVEWQVRVACQAFYILATDDPKSFTPEALRTFVLGLLEGRPTANLVSTCRAKSPTYKTTSQPVLTFEDGAALGDVTMFDLKIPDDGPWEAAHIHTHNILRGIYVTVIWRKL